MWRRYRIKAWYGVQVVKRTVEALSRSAVEEYAARVFCRADRIEVSIKG